MSAPPQRQLTMVVPTYNERDRLDALIEQIFAACRAHQIDVEVVIVDDNSPDGTGECADAWTRRGAVRVIHRPGKLGLGSAVSDGFATARSPIVGVMDADLSHPPSLIPALYASIVADDLDMVVASRYTAGGATTSWFLGRWLLSRLGCWASRPLTPVRDPMSGFFLIRRERLVDLRLSTRGFKIGLELLVRANPRRVAEIGYVFVGRAAGRSKMSVGEGVRFLRQIVVLYTHVWRRPLPSPARLVTPVAFQAEERPAALRTLGS